MRRDRSSLRIRISSQPFADCVVSVGKLTAACCSAATSARMAALNCNHIGAVKFSKVTSQVPGHNEFRYRVGFEIPCPNCAQRQIKFPHVVPTFCANAL